MKSVFVAALTMLTAAQAQAQSDVTQPGSPWLTNIGMPRSTAMGGAGAAVSTSNEAILLNPAGLAQGRHYFLEADGALDKSFPAQNLTFSVLDSTSGPVATGAVYSHWGSGSGGDGRGQGWFAGLAYAYAVGSFFFGGVTKYFHFDVPGNDQNPSGTVHKFAEDIGLLARRGDFSWAAVLQNISTSNDPLFPLTATGAMQFGNDQSSHLAFDYKADLHDSSRVAHSLAAGYEILLDPVALRAGGTWDITNSLWWGSAGITLLTDKLSISLVYKRRFSNGLDYAFQGGITLYLE